MSTKTTLTLILGGLLFAASTLFVHATEAGDQKIDKHNWEKITDGTDYTESYKEFEKTQRTPKERTMPKLRNIKPILWIILVVLIVLLAVIIARIVLSREKNALIKTPKVTIDNLDRNIHNVDLEMILKNYLAEEKFRQCVRIYFLMFIKKLSSLNLIVWKKNKTNLDYQLELSDHPIQEEYSTLKSIYEHVWFGKAKVEKGHFAAIKELMENALNQLDVNK